jgi:uncharacterized membrane protein (DUF373 family)
MSTDAAGPSPRTRFITTSLLGIEQFFYVAIALGLSAGCLVLFGHVAWTFVKHVRAADMSPAVLELLEGVLLVFILTELIHTIGAIIKERVLTTEPFLIVGIVAAVRRLLVITVEAPEVSGEALRLALWEVAAMVLVVIGLGFTIFLVRHTYRTEPRPSHAPEPKEG